ncbi:hypothetical protein A2U01_0099388, partial [Trifolium medium]|nr:hypothetical protein [Trifolium medium]
ANNNPGAAKGVVLIWMTAY